MYSVKVLKNIFWVGVIDWNIRHFHGFSYSTHRGTTYNAYLILDEKVALVDTVKHSFTGEMIEKIKEVISNLLLNSIKYTPPRGAISIDSRESDGFVIISIKDNGIGLTDGEKSQLFRQFGKVERYGQGWNILSEGSGLGLYISKELIELHGGELWVESDGRNKGSTFHFSLPIIK